MSLLVQIPQSKLADRAFITLLLSQQWPAEAHRPEILYDVILPWLADGTVPRTIQDDPCSDYRTAPRANTSSTQCLLEGVRYLLRRRGLSVDQCKQFSMMFRRELVVMVQSDMQRVIELEDKGLAISVTHQKMVGLVLQQLAHKAIKEADAGRLHDGALEAIDMIGDDVVKVMGEMTVLELAEADCESSLPSSIGAEEKADCFKDFEYFHLLRKRDPKIGEEVEDDYAGEGGVTSTAEVVDMTQLKAKGSVNSMIDIIQALRAVKEVVKQLMDRAYDDKAQAASHLIMHYQVIEIIGECFTQVIPVPASAGQPCVWAPVTLEMQKELLQEIYSAMFTYGQMWQDLEEPTRQNECERAVVVACIFACFDKALRTPAADGVLPITEQMNDDGGYHLPLCLERLRGQLPLITGSQRYELADPHLTESRAAVVSYFEDAKAANAHEVFDLVIEPGPNKGMIYLHKDEPTCEFVQHLVLRCGYGLVPGGQHRPKNEMEAVVKWMFSGMDWVQGPYEALAQEHPEFEYLRDICTLFKHLSSSLPATRETLTMGKDQDVKNFELVFDQGSKRHLTRQTSGNLYWSCLDQPGYDPYHTKAHVQVFWNGGRQLIWGEGETLKSPADTEVIFGKPYITEDDVLHTESKKLIEMRQIANTLNPVEAEQVLSFLTVPYIRIPLVVGFFASNERTSLLFNAPLQNLLRAVLFEQGPWVPADETEIEKVPLRMTKDQEAAYMQRVAQNAATMNVDKEALGAPTGLLLNELRCCPEGTLKPLLRMLRYVEEVQHSSVHSEDAKFVIYMISLAITMEKYVIHALAAPELVDPNVLDELRKYREELANYLRGLATNILSAWIFEASAEVPTGYATDQTAQNIPTLSVVHSYLALCWGNLEPVAAPAAVPAADDSAVTSVSGMSAKVVGEFLGHMAFVRTYHSFGQILVNLELNVDDASDPKKIEAACLKALTLFMQSHGIDNNRINQDYLRGFLTGEPLWFRYDRKVVRVPLPGIQVVATQFADEPH